MRHLNLVLCFTIVILVIGSGCISNSLRESDTSQSLSDTSTLTRSHIVAASVTRQGNSVIITWQGGPDAAVVAELQYGLGIPDKKWESPKTGESVTLPGRTLGKDHVLVVAQFTDGIEQLIVDTYV